MFNLRKAFALWAIVPLFLGSAGRAQAQTTGTTTTGITVTVPTTGVTRDHQDGAGKVLVTQINLRDCLSEDKFNFTVNLSTGTNLGSYSLEVWAGTNCDQLTARTNVTATCWSVADPRTPTTIIVNNLEVPVQQLLSGRTGGKSLGTDETGGTGGTDSTGGTGGTDATGGSNVGGSSTDTGGGGTSGAGGSNNTIPSECRATSTVTAPQTLALYFMLIQADGTVGGQAQYKVTFKLNAPPPPSNIQTDIGENIAPISWNPPSDGSDQTIDGYQLYCDPPPGEQGVIDSGIEWDPNILPAACVKSDVLYDGARPDDKYKCGTASKTSTHANATGLVNNVPYNVTVATTDSYRNVGVTAAPQCAKPQPVTGFFEAYRAAGGEAGGGFCSFSRHQRPGVLLVVFGLGLGLVLRRRRAT